MPGLIPSYRIPAGNSSSSFLYTAAVVQHFFVEENILKDVRFRRDAAFPRKPSSYWSAEELFSGDPI